jgi:hypothetical protein
MLDQIRIDDKYSLDDFFFSMRERKIGEPTKKSIKETVPFSNKTYDFSNINGELYWNERSLEYVFECIMPTPEEIENAKIAFSNWLMLIQEANLYDPYIEDYHFIATFDDISYEDEVEKTTATVKFSAYPFKIANKKTSAGFTVNAGEEITVVVANNSGRKLPPEIYSDFGASLKLNDVIFGIPAGETTDSRFNLEVGRNIITITNNSDVGGAISFSFFEEVF